jgi:hypothetical protein
MTTLLDADTLAFIVGFQSRKDSVLTSVLAGRRIGRPSFLLSHRASSWP